MINKKICTSCKQEKNINEYSLNKGKHREKCKTCLQKYMKEHYEKNKQTYINYSKVSNQNYYNWFKNLKSTLKCEKCGENHIATLDFHHTDPSQKEFEIGVAKWNKMAKHKLLNEISKCIVLCSNCHRKLHYDEKFMRV